LTVLANTSDLINEVAKLIAQWHPDALVIGLPLTADGEEQPMTHHARRFGDALQKRFKLPIAWVDERYTSRAVNEDFRAARAQGSARKKHAEKLDAHAAQRILEQFLRS
jgi:putative holliday junction resolvase